MQNHIWGQTLLSVYRYLERLAGAIDKIIEKKALSSSNMFSGEGLANATMDLADKIIELSEKKIKLINVKVLTEKALKNMNPFDAKLLIMRYLKREQIDKILEVCGCSRRTYFRKLSSALSSFEEKCARSGFSNERLSKYLGKEKWIEEVKNSFEHGVDPVESISIEN